MLGRSGWSGQTRAASKASIVASGVSQTAIYKQLKQQVGVGDSKYVSREWYKGRRCRCLSLKLSIMDNVDVMKLAPIGGVMSSCEVRTKTGGTVCVTVCGTVRRKTR